MSDTKYFIGIDVGSTTVKAVVVDTSTDEIIWQDYQRHETRQPEMVLEFLETIESTLPEGTELEENFEVKCQLYALLYYWYKSKKEGSRFEFITAPADFGFM